MQNYWTAKNEGVTVWRDLASLGWLISALKGYKKQKIVWVKLG